MMLSGQGEVEVVREKLAACMTCRLCNKLFRDATTISECLHTFCRKCIYKKISDEDLDSCPVCYIELGCAPLEKLRADHSLQDLRVKVFAPKTEKAVEVDKDVSSVQEPVPSAVEVESPDPLPARRKERSIASLVDSTPKVSAKLFITGRRLKSMARKMPALRESFSVIDEPEKTVDGSCDAEVKWEKMQTSSAAASSKQLDPSKDTEDSVENGGGNKADLLTPLNILLEAANHINSNDSGLQDIFIHETLPSARVCEAQVLKSSVNGHCDEPNDNNVAKKSTSPPSGSAKPGAQVLKSNVNDHDESKVTNEAKKPTPSPSASPKPSAQMLKSNVNGHSGEPKVTNEAKKSGSPPSASPKYCAQMLKSNVNGHSDKPKVTDEAKKSTSSPSGSTKPSAQMLNSNVSEHRDELKVTSEAKKSSSSSPGSGKARAQVLKSNVNEHCDKRKVSNEGKKSSSSSSGSAKSRNKQLRKQKKGSTSEGLNIQPQVVVEANNKPVEQPRPVWFSLVPSTDKGRNAALPKIPARFIRVKDDKMTVSIIRKYLMQKLGLASDSEVELSLCGHPLDSALEMHELIDWWLQLVPTWTPIRVTTGSSGEEAVMVLNYHRKTASP